MNNLLCIVGPTGTGKTKLALYLASLFPSILVSADSRQVYRGMDIVTGKDHPAGQSLIGLDLVNPTEPCSISVWYDAVMPHITRAWGEGKLPIIVGGTGLYVKALVNGIPTLHVPLNPQLRESLAPLSLTELQAKLTSLDQAKYARMNRSDAHNPRRLIRAIEVATSSSSPLESDLSNLKSKIIGLKYYDDSQYRSRIRDRVHSRLELGALSETKKLLVSANSQSLSAIGYRSLVSYLRGELEYQTMIDAWVRDEVAYSKRQLTYFRKLPMIDWHAAEPLDLNRVATSVKAWYDKAKDQEV